jgi:hypothetical protein
MREIPVCLATFGTAFGWQHYGSSGEIHIPAVSLARLCRLIGYEYCSLRNVLRHEYGHALADTHRGLFRSREFVSAFGASHEAEIEWEFDPEHHVSRYAATSPMEDFAETFMLYVAHSGAMPRHLDTTVIRTKWRFIRLLGSHVGKGRRRFV